MYMIGEEIQVISTKVRKAIESRDKAPIQKLAVDQVEAGADALEVNIGPQKKAGPEVMEWMVDTIQEVVDVPLCLDTTNLAAMEAGLKRVKRQAIVNSIGRGQPFERRPPSGRRVRRQTDRFDHG